MVADQTGGGGGEGGKTTAVAENQISLARGSAEMTVICGRLKDKQGRSRASKHQNTPLKHNRVYEVHPLEILFPLPSLYGVVTLARFC